MPQPMTTTGARGLLGLRDLVTPGDLPAIAALELQVVEEEASQLPFDGPPAEEAHHLSQQISGELHRDAPIVAVGGDRREGTATHLGHVLPGHPALDVQRHADVRLDLAPHPRRVTAHVHERGHQRRDADLFERAGDGLVAVLERLPGETVSRHDGHPRRPSLHKAIDSGSAPDLANCGQGSRRRHRRPPALDRPGRRLSGHVRERPRRLHRQRGASRLPEEPALHSTSHFETPLGVNINCETGGNPVKMSAVLAWIGISVSTSVRRRHGPSTAVREQRAHRTQDPGGAVPDRRAPHPRVRAPVRTGHAVRRRRALDAGTWHPVSHRGRLGAPSRLHRAPTALRGSRATPTFELGGAVLLL